MEEIVRAKRLEIVDDDRRTRACLGVEEIEDSGKEMVSLSMRGKSGNTSILVGVPEEEGTEEEAAFVTLSDSNRKPRVTVSLDREGNPLLALTKPDGSLGLVMQVGSRSTSLNIVGETVDSGVLLCVEEDNTILLRLGDSEGQSRASLAPLEDGTPSLNLSDKEGQIRASSRLLEIGEPVFYLLDEEGDTTHSIPSDADWVSEN
jgi:hypothetical protein